MEEQQQPEQQQTDLQSSLFQLQLDANTVYLLRSAASWSNVMAWVGIVIGGLLCICAFLMQNVAATGSAGYEGFLGDAEGGARAEKAAGVLLLVVFLIIGAIFIISGILSLKFSRRIRVAIDTTDGLTLRNGLAALRTYFTFRTVIMIIWGLIVLLMLVGLMNPTPVQK